MELTLTEKIALRGIVARDADINEKFVKPLQRDYKDLLKEIEMRLELEEGSIGKTHTLDLNTLQVSVL